MDVIFALPVVAVNGSRGAETSAQHAPVKGGEPTPDAGSTAVGD
ncbi:MAG TPA: hypothetical protein VFP61_00960 [Acidimicrobiales bacterium]|nr:hypothetical protein [Acidimicrobiales bacterium]